MNRILHRCRRDKPYRHDCPDRGFAWIRQNRWKSLENAEVSTVDRAWTRWPVSCSLACMSFSQVVDRARAHFTEMPGLELTLPEAVRLLGFGVDDCRYVIDALVDAGFLRWTARRTVVRTDAMWGRQAGLSPGTPERRSSSSYVSVRRVSDRNRTVGGD